MTTNQLAALRMFGRLTAGRFDAYDLAGPANAWRRSALMTTLNGTKTPQARAGVTALRAAFHALNPPTGDCIAARDAAFTAWAQAAIKG